MNTQIFMGFEGLVGACLGSFSSLVAYRLRRGLPIVNARSMCPQCHSKLGIKDLIPIISWVWSGGKCRHCGQIISARYLYVEVVMAIAAVAASWAEPNLIGWALICSLSVALMVLSLIDLEEFIIPDEAIISTVLLGLIWIFYHGLNLPGATPLSALLLEFKGLILGAGLGFGGVLLRFIFQRLRGVEALGMGDVKLFFASGLWLKAPEIGTFLFLSGAIGIVLGIIWRISHGPGRFPFGPAIASSLFATIILQAM